AVGLTEASAWRDVGAENSRSGARRHIQGLAVQMDQLYQGIPAAMVRPEQRPAVLLQVKPDSPDRSLEIRGVFGVSSFITAHFTTTTDYRELKTQAEMGHTCRGTINLATANIAVEDSCNFVISNGGAQTYHLKASSEVERQRWITALELAKAKAVRMHAESGESRESRPVTQSQPSQPSHAQSLRVSRVTPSHSESAESRPVTQSQPSHAQSLRVSRVTPSHSESAESRPVTQSQPSHAQSLRVSRVTPSHSESAESRPVTQSQPSHAQSLRVSRVTPSHSESAESRPVTQSQPSHAQSLRVSRVTPSHSESAESRPVTQSQPNDSGDECPSSPPMTGQGVGARNSEVQSTLRTLGSKVEDLSTCNDLIAKHGSALQRSLSELESIKLGGETSDKIRQVTERATLFRITSNAMINACRDFLALAQAHSKRWQKALQAEREQRVRLEETLEQLAKQHNHLERAFRGATVLPASSSNTTADSKASAAAKGDASDDEENEFFDACEEFITVPADPKYHRRSGSNVSGISSEMGMDDGTTSLDEQSLTSNPESPQSQELEPVRKRRTRIPDKPNYSLNLWSIMKNCIGKELSKIPMPVNFNEPISMLQRLSEDLEYSELLDRAAKCQSSLEQLCYVAAFTVSSYSTTVHRTGKPFNPLLGETFELDRLQESGYRSLCEQVRSEGGNGRGREWGRERGREWGRERMGEGENGGGREGENGG
ncbi:hypothetical protein QTP86_029841, partial [Hemibagrus guttatus]